MSDFQAFGVPTEYKRVGFHIPAGVSVIGLDGAKVCARLDLPPTTLFGR
jgi:hypothetical protein